MKEYIERVAVLNLLEKINPVDYGSMFDYQAHRAVSECLREARYGVESIPAADVAEVRHGKWNINEFFSDDVQTAGEYSICGEWISWFRNLPNYCPNCGARMDKEDEHEAD